MDQFDDILKFFSEDTPASERERMEKDLPADSSEAADLDMLKEIWSASEEIDGFEAFDAEAGWTRFAENVPEARNEARQFSLWSYAAVAASLALFVMSGLYYLNRDTSYYATVETTDNWNQITLSDGSQVMLYENSKLRYPKSFDSEETRRIWLEGDALVRVAEDPSKEFVTRNFGAEVLALGTEYKMESDSTEQGYFSTVENVGGQMRLYSAADTSIKQDLENVGDRATFDGQTIDYQPAIVALPPDTPGVYMPIYDIINELQYNFPRNFEVISNMPHNPDGRVKVDLNQSLLGIMTQLDTTASIDFVPLGRRVRLLRFYER